MSRAAPVRTARARGAPPARLIGLLAVVLAWEGAARLLEGSYVLAGPVAVAGHVAGNAGLLWRATGATVSAAAQGFVWGNLAAAAMALLAVAWPRGERAVSALALVVFCLPLVATGPILRVLLGPGDGPQVALAALAVYYTTFLSLLVGVRAVPASWVDLMRSYGRGRITTLVRVRLRAAVPYLIAGLQIAAPAAVLGAMVGEFTGAERGLGVLTVRAMRALDVAATWSVATVATAVALAAYAAFGALGRRLARDRPPLLLAPPAAARRARPWRRAAEAAAIALAALAAWQVGMDLPGLDPFFAKRPGDVLAHLVTDADAAANRALLGRAFAETLAFALPGYLAGLALGAGLACLLVLAPPLSAAAMPLAVALRSVPIVATAPLIVLALGRGAAGTITIVAAMIFFPTLVACLQGLRQTAGEVRDLFDSYAAPRWRLLVLARLPAMLPALFASARMAIPPAILAVTTAEWLATGRGLGSLMATTASTSDYGTLWSAIALVAVAAVLAHAAVGRLEARVLRVYAAEQLAR